MLVKSERGLRAPADAVGRTARRTDASGGQASPTEGPGEVAL